MLPCPKATERAVVGPLVAREPVLPSQEGRKEEIITGERTFTHSHSNWAKKRLSCLFMGN